MWGGAGGRAGADLGRTLEDLWRTLGRVGYLRGSRRCAVARSLVHGHNVERIIHLVHDAQRLPIRFQFFDLAPQPGRGLRQSWLTPAFAMCTERLCEDSLGHHLAGPTQKSFDQHVFLHVQHHHLTPGRPDLEVAGSKRKAVSNDHEDPARRLWRALRVSTSSRQYRGLTEKGCGRLSPGPAEVSPGRHGWSA